MSIIKSIRERSGLAVGIIALGLVLFVVGGDILQPNSSLMNFFTGNDQQSIGKIAGEKVNYQEFNNLYENIKRNYESSANRKLSEQETQGMSEQAWNFLIFQKAYKIEFEALGLTVSDKELEQLVQGDSIFISPRIRQIPAFQNPETKKFDKQLVLRYLQGLGSLPKEQRMAWVNFEDELKAERLKQKYENLLKISSYTTKAEAEREFENQNTKANVNYVYVPFTSIVDSTIKVSDAQLKEYLSKNEKKYKSRAIETRSVEYISFDISPSSEDSSAFLAELRTLAKNLAISKDDSSFAKANSDPGLAGIPFEFVSPDRIPVTFFNSEIPTLLKGGIYGPFSDGKSYKILKVVDTKEDTVSYARASHILIKAASESKEDKQKAKEQAESILKEIKDGASFEEKARVYGGDGTKDRGGDLGFFKRQAMVKPFADAVFAVNDIKLLPTVVETQFGYHIVKVTHPKIKSLYKLAAIEKILDPSPGTRDEAYKKAEEFMSQSKTPEEFRNMVKKNPSLVIQKAEKLASNANQVNTLTGARELVRWAFNTAKLNDVSPVFDLQDQNKFVIAVLTAKTEKDVLDISLFKDELTNEVRKEIKGKQILDKINKSKGELESIAKEYGNSASFANTADVALSANAFASTGANPNAIGKTFGLKVGQQSTAFIDETGVFILKVNAITPASKIADYTQYKNQLNQSLMSRNAYYLNEAIKENSKIEDKRYKFY